MEPQATVDSVRDLRELIRSMQLVLGKALVKLKELEKEPRGIRQYAGGGARNFASLQGTIADAQTPNTLLLDGSRAMTGDLDLAGNKLLTTNLGLYEYDADTLYVRNRAGTATKTTLVAICKSAYGWLAFWYPAYLRTYAHETLGEIKFQSYTAGPTLVNSAILVGGEFQIPRLGDVTILTGKNIVPQTPQGSSLGDLTHEFDAIYVERIMFAENDFLNYDETNDRFRFYIGNVCKGYVDATGFHDGAP